MVQVCTLLTILLCTTLTCLGDGPGRALKAPVAAEYMGLPLSSPPLDMNVLHQVLFDSKPDVVVWVGGEHHASILWIAHGMDVVNNGRVVAVGFKRGLVDAAVRDHPRVTVMEGNALTALDRVLALVSPKHDRSMVVIGGTLSSSDSFRAMELYGTLVIEGSWMVLEQANSNIQTFLKSPLQRTKWRILEHPKESVLGAVSWGFLQKLGNAGRSPPSELLHAGGLDRQAVYEYHSQWNLVPLDYARFIESVDRAVVYDMSQIKLSAEGDGSPTTFTFTPRESGNGNDVLLDVRDACMQIYETDSDICIASIFAKLHSTLPYTADMGVPMHDWELDTPLHVYAPRSSFETVRCPHRLPPAGAAAAAVREKGVAVVGPVTGKGAVGRIRSVITGREEFSEKSPSMSPADRSRYLDPLCGMKSNRCRAWDPSFFEMIEDPYVLQEVEIMLGSDCILDSTAISVQWAGEPPFGPHVDRPLVEKNDGSAWPYSSEDYPSPPLDSPVSVQVLWLLDNFTASNGAFYVLKDSLERENRGKRPNLPHGMYPMKGNPQLVTGLEGSIIIAHGAVWHGAAQNFYPRPRIAFLVQYVPKFVRPGQRYPYEMLPRDSSERLKSLFDMYRFDIRGTLEVQIGGLTKEIEYDKRTLEGAYAGAFDAASAVESSQYEMANNFGMEAEDEVLKRSLLNYDMCHAPPTSAGRRRPESNTRSRRSYVMKEHHPTAGFSMPPMAFGVGGTTAGMPENDAIDLVASALKAGVLHLDLAEMYGNQRALGKLFRALWGGPETNNSLVPSGKYAGIPRRDSIFITSKLWCTNMSPEHANDALMLTLQLLQLSYLDLWLIHWPVPLEHVGLAGPSLEGVAFPQDRITGAVKFAAGYSICDTWHAMEASQERGLTRRLGVYNFPKAMLHNIINCHHNVRPLVNQIEAHPYLPQNEMIKFANLVNVSVQAYSPLGGLLQSGERGLFVDPIIRAVAAANKKTEAEVLLRWSIQRGIPVVSTSRKKSRIEQFLGVKDGFQLSREDMEKINSIRTRARFMAPEPFAFLFGE